ncbi:MAG: NADPH:quinone oxidoreductase family protein [Pseudomonadales bacterium]
MKAVVAQQLGPSAHYNLLETDVPEPGPGQVQIKVQVAGMGYVDGLVSRGLYQVKPPVPYCPGLELAGTVSKLGAGVTTFALGERVSASAFGGGLAQFAVVDVAAVQSVPENLDIRAAAGFLINYITAWHGLLDRGALQPGETVLVLGAAGGVGVAAVQVARLAGARVIAGASSAAKREFALTHGAHEVLDYSQADWRAELKQRTGGRGVDVVFDPVGGRLLEPAFRSLAWRGRHLVVGFAGGDIPALPVNLALLKGSALIGVDYRQFGSVYEASASAAIREQLFAAVQRGDLAPPLGATFAFADYRAAMDLAASRDGVGKTVVRIAE